MADAAIVIQNFNEPDATHAILAAQQSSLLHDARKASLDADWHLALKLWRELRNGGLVTLEVKRNIGLCLLKLGDRENARETPRRVLSSHPDDRYSLSIMAHILRQTRSSPEPRGSGTDSAKNPGCPNGSPIVPSMANSAASPRV
jgi:hypothetical protein